MKRGITCESTNLRASASMKHTVHLIGRGGGGGGEELICNFFFSDACESLFKLCESVPSQNSKKFCYIP